MFTIKRLYQRLGNCSNSNQIGNALFEENRRGYFSIAHPEKRTRFPNDTNRLPIPSLKSIDKCVCVCVLLTKKNEYFLYNASLSEHYR